MTENICIEKINIEGIEKNIAGQLEYDIKNKDTEKNIVLFIHGSGESDRDGSVYFANRIVSKNFKIISDMLVKNDISTFRFDKNYGYQIHKIIQDAICVTKYLKNRNDVGKIYIYGWSEGVRVIANIIKEIDGIDGLILQSGVAKGWDSYFKYILEELVSAELRKIDKDNDGLVNICDFEDYEFNSSSVSFAFNTMLLRHLDNGVLKFNDKVDTNRDGVLDIENDWISIAKRVGDNSLNIANYVENFFLDSWNGELKVFSKFDKSVLILHGINDGWVNPVESVEFTKAMSQNVDIKLFPGLGHSLQKVNSPLEDIGGEVDVEAIEDILNWLIFKIRKEVD